MAPTNAPKLNAYASEYFRTNPPPQLSLAFRFTKLDTSHGPLLRRTSCELPITLASMATKKGGFSIIVDHEIIRLHRPTHCDCDALLAEIARQCNEEIDSFKPLKVKKNYVKLKSKSMIPMPMIMEVVSIAGDCVEAAGYRILGLSSGTTSVYIFCSSKV